MKDKILQLKKELYSLLLDIDDDEITDNELDIITLLSKDKQVQDFINSQLKGK